MNVFRFWLWLWVAVCLSSRPLFAQTDPSFEGAPLLTDVSPAVVAVRLGEPLNLTVTVQSAGGPFTSQWSHNGQPLPQPTSPALQVAATTFDHAGYYQLTVTTDTGTATSRVFWVRVLPRTSTELWGHFSMPPSSGKVVNPPSMKTATRLVAVATGVSHQLGLTFDGEVVGWGFNAFGQLTIPSDLKDVVSVVAGRYTSYALSSDGSVRRWGSTSLEPTNSPATGFVMPPNPLVDIVALRAGFKHMLALKADGTVIAWGFNDLKQAAVPAGLPRVRAIAAGAHFSLALTVSGQVFLWGVDPEQKFGRKFPSNLTGVVGVAAGATHILVLHADGTVSGYGSMLSGAPPSVPSGLPKVVEVAANDDWCMVRTEAGQIIKWEGSKAPTTSPAPSLPLSQAVLHPTSYSSVHLRDRIEDVVPAITAQPVAQSVRVGARVVFAVEAQAPFGSLDYQWRRGGVALDGQVSNQLVLPGVTEASQGEYDVVVSNPAGAVVSSPATLLVQRESLPVSGPRYRVVAPGESIVLTSELVEEGGGTIQWYRDGQRLDGQTSPAYTVPSTPAFVDGAYWLTVTDASGTRYSEITFVRRRSAQTRVRSWGASPLPFAGTGVVVDIAAGASYAHAILGNGDVVRWGDASAGGDFRGIPNLVTIGNGTAGAAALKTDGTLAFSGDASWSHPVPGAYQEPTAATNTYALSVGPDFGLAVTQFGTVVGWGAIIDPQDQSRSNPLRASTLRSLERVCAVAAGKSHWLALKTDGTVEAFGGWYGNPQLLLPARNTDIVSIAAAEDFSLFLHNDGTVSARWGYAINSMAPPADLQNVVAIAAGASAAHALLADGRIVSWGQKGGVSAVSPAGFLPAYAMSGGGEYALAVTMDVLVSASGSVSEELPKVVPQPIPVTGDRLRVLRGGESTELSVAVPESGGGSFQWYRNGLMLPGQTGSALRVHYATEEADGAYWVEYQEPLGSPRRSEITFVRRQARAPRVIGWGTASAWALPDSSPNAEVVALIPGDRYAHGVRADGTLLRWGGSPYAESDDAYLTASGQVVGFGLSQSGRRAVLTASGQLVFSGPGSWTRFSEIQREAEPTTANAVFALSTSPYHGLAVRTDGTVLAWGDNVGGQATVPVGLSGVCAVAAGTNHSLALLANRQVVAWGSNLEGQCNVPNLTDVIAIAAGWNYSLALRSNGTVVAWGKGECVPPPVDLVGVVAIGASLQPASHIWGLSESAWALTKAGRVVIWGNNLAGKAVVPSDLPSALGVVAGPGYTLALVAGTVSYGDFVDQVARDKSPQVQAALANAAGDFDGDGQTNFLEYALGSDPLAAEVHQGPDIIEREGHLYFTYQRRRDNPGLVYQPEASSDLRTWVAGPTVFEECEVRTIDPEREQVIVRDKGGLQPGKGRFLRLKINP